MGNRLTRGLSRVTSGATNVVRKVVQEAVVAPAKQVVNVAEKVVNTALDVGQKAGDAVVDTGQRALKEVAKPLVKLGEAAVKQVAPMLAGSTPFAQQESALSLDSAVVPQVATTGRSPEAPQQDGTEAEVSKGRGRLGKNPQRSRAAFTVGRSGPSAGASSIRI